LPRVGEVAAEGLSSKKETDRRVGLRSSKRRAMPEAA
jgi:hypothetical protein